MSASRTPSSEGYDIKDPEIAKGAAETTTTSSSEKSASLRIGQSDGGVIAVGGNLDSYRPIPEYEGAHRFDPTYEWTENEEKRLVRRVCAPTISSTLPMLWSSHADLLCYLQLDYKICSFVCLMFFALQLDRGNISQALSDNMLSDLGMITNQYNYGMTIFYLCFLCAELPSQMISKKLGPDVCKLG